MAVTGFVDPALDMLARRAGILVEWRDAAGQPQQVAEPVLRNLLTALGLPCLTPSQISDSLHCLDEEHRLKSGDMVVVQAGQRPQLRHPGTGKWQLVLESGASLNGTLRADSNGTATIPPVDEIGYHGLVLDDVSVTLAVVPLRCKQLAHANDARMQWPWGMVAQIYSLWEGEQPEVRDPERGNPALPRWTRGSHFGAVAKVAVQAAHHGADALALSPAHAMFSADATRYAPYSPSSRLFLNVGYGDPSMVLGSEVVRDVLSSWPSQDAFVATHKDQLLDWPTVFPLRLRLLRDVFDHFSAHGPPHLASKFDAFRTQGAMALEHHACYEAIHAHYAKDLGRGHGWEDWPATLHDPDSAAVARFASGHEGEVAFHAFAQWIAHESLLQAQGSARSAGMAIGLVGDLAIGTDPRGSHAWSRQNDILGGVSVGAPPDIYQPRGQNWGLTAFSPRGLRSGAYGAFIETLRATLRYCGGVRVDHIAGLERLWLIPEESRPTDGAYLAYPRDDLLGLLVLEAVRHDAVAIGENLGTVSDELNEGLRERGVLGTSVLWFERESRPAPAEPAPFLPAHCWSPDEIAMPTTHDLPTVHGWWQERDIQWKQLLGQISPEQQLKEENERMRDRGTLWEALRNEGCVSSLSVKPPQETPLTAILSFVAQTPSPLALFSLEDFLGVIDQPNMPGEAASASLVQHPNWVQALPTGIDALFEDPVVAGRVYSVCQARSRA